MRCLFAAGTALLVMFAGVFAASSQETQPSERQVRITPKVTLALSPKFTALPTKIRGLNEIIVQLPGKRSGYVQVTTEKRRSAEEATARLLEVAQETDKSAFVALCGWPAMERQYRLRLAQVMASRGKEPQGEAPIVQAATIAIAQDDTLIRFQAVLSPKAPAEDTLAIFALVRTISCPANPNPDLVKSTIEKLGQELSQSPKGPSATKVLSPAVTPQLSLSGPAKRVGNIGLASTQTAFGTSSSEIQIAASADSKTVVVGSNGGVSFSSDYGNSFTPSTLRSPFSNGDPTLATGASGNFYLSGVNLSTSACSDPVDVDTTKTGATFILAGNAASCPFTGNICFPDQPQMAADGKNSASTGDQVYVVWRNFPNWNAFNGTCTGIGGGFPTPTIACSSDNGATWSSPTAAGSGDFGRITVGPDGFVYVTYVINPAFQSNLLGARVLLNKFSSCASGLMQQPGFPVTVASYWGVECPIDGLDRCEIDATGSPQPAILADSPKDVFVAYAEQDFKGNDDIVVRHSRDGGLTWPDKTLANTSKSAHRFLPWICASGSTANLSWYDRRAATSADDSLTSYFFNTVSGSNVIGTETNISVSTDSQKAPATTCCPKYGDYNGNACTGDRIYLGWASATAPPGVVVPGAGGPGGGPGTISTFVEAIPPGPPMVTSVSPAQMQCGSGTAITITGANFRGVSGVQLESQNQSVPVSSFTVNSTVSITATVPSNLPGGIYEAVVTTPSGASIQPVLSTRTDLFSVAPTVATLNPKDGPVSGATPVKVSGTCFDSSTRISFGGKDASISQCSSTECMVYSPASSIATSVDVTAKSGGAVSSTLPADLFTYDGVQITGISPSSGPITGGTQVTVTGSGFPAYDFHTLQNTPMSFGGLQTVAECDITWCTVITPASQNPGPVDVVASAFGTTSGPSSNDVFSYTAKPKLVRFEVVDTYSGMLAIAGLDGNASTGGATVALSSSDPSLVIPPATETIQAGHLTAAVPVTVNPSPSNENVTLTAIFDGTFLTSTVLVPASPLVTLSIDATALDLGQSATVTIGINSPAPASGTTVSVSSSSSSAIAVPTSVTVPAGNYSTTFPITNQYSGGSNYVTIQASYNGATASDTILVFVPPPRCAAQTCPKLYYWNSTDCKCERAVIQPH